jgi:glycosyltransferase involved in cell wall biosynthesis
MNLPASLPHTRSPRSYLPDLFRHSPFCSADIIGAGEQLQPRPARTGERPPRSIALLGNYAPRRCGIATFTQDLRAGLLDGAPRLQVPVAMLSDDPAGYACPEEVRFIVDQNSRADHRLCAKWINESAAEAVCVQHEFGIYGGPNGIWLLDVLRNLLKPVVTTCHTVLREPSPEQWDVMREMARHSARLVVMAEKGRELLRDVYGVPESKVTVISHGIPEMTVPDAECIRLRRDLGWTEHKVMLTFGLLSPHKGIEYAIRALPEIAHTHPKIRYVVVGATHPNLVREQGEQYRDSLRALAETLGVSERLQFIDRFVSRDELVRLIAAADIYTTPYLNEAQITSGTLAYAFGLGKPVVSTPYWHAAELLAEDAGVLVPFRDSAALAVAVQSLLSDDARRVGISKLAMARGRGMTWPRIGQHYLTSIGEAVRERIPAPVLPSRRSAAA